MGFIKKAFEFVAHPSHSRTLGLVLMFVLVAAVSLTVYVSQQQQEIRQRASGSGQIASYAPEPRNTDPDLANVAGNFGCKEGYNVISPEICCPSGTIYCNLPKDNPINLCADNSDACDALIEARTGIPDCGDNLKCDASTINGACSAGQNKCLSSKGFGGAEKASPNGKSVVCCSAPTTPTPTPGPKLALLPPVPSSTPLPTRPQCPAPQLSITNITETSILTRILNSNPKFRYRFIITKPDGSAISTYYMSGAAGNSGGTVENALTPGTNYTVFANVFESDIAAECQAPGPASAQSITTLSTVPTPTPTLNKKAGEKCVSSEECEAEFVCALITGMSIKTCMIAFPTPQSFPTSTPTPKKPMGAICKETKECQSGLACDYTGEDLYSKCAIPSCGSNNGKNYGSCASGACIQSGATDGSIYECVNPIAAAPIATPTPTPICGTLGGQCCSTTPECQQGTFCSGNNICISTAGKIPTPTAIPTCPFKTKGDANCDGKINITDFNIWRDEFKKYLTSSTADFNKDGGITIVDYNILRDGLKNIDLPHQ